MGLNQENPYPTFPNFEEVQDSGLSLVPDSVTVISKKKTPALNITELWRSLSWIKIQILTFKMTFSKGPK